MFDLTDSNVCQPHGQPLAVSEGQSSVLGETTTGTPAKTNPHVQHEPSVTKDSTSTHIVGDDSGDKFTTFLHSIPEFVNLCKLFQVTSVVDGVAEEPEAEQGRTIGQRASKRLRIPTNRYTPPVVVPKTAKVTCQGRNKKGAHAGPVKSGKGKKVVTTAAAPTANINHPKAITPAAPIGPLIGGFCPFAGENGFRQAAFSTRILDAR